MAKNFSKKYPFFVKSQLRTLLDFDRDDVRPTYLDNITEGILKIHLSAFGNIQVSSLLWSSLHKFHNFFQFL